MRPQLALLHSPGHASSLAWKHADTAPCPAEEIKNGRLALLAFLGFVAQVCLSPHQLSCQSCACSIPAAHPGPSCKLLPVPAASTSGCGSSKHLTMNAHAEPVLAYAVCRNKEGAIGKPGRPRAAPMGIQLHYQWDLCPKCRPDQVSGTGSLRLCTSQAPVYCVKTETDWMVSAYRQGMLPCIHAVKHGLGPLLVQFSHWLLQS